MAAIAIPRFSGFQDRAEEKAAIAEAKTIYTALVTLNADGVSIGSGFTGTTALTDLTGPLNGAISNVTDYQSFTYTSSNGVVVTYAGGVQTVPAP